MRQIGNLKNSWMKIPKVASFTTIFIFEQYWIWYPPHFHISKLKFKKFLDSHWFNHLRARWLYDEVSLPTLWHWQFLPQQSFDKTFTFRLSLSFFRGCTQTTTLHRFPKYTTHPQASKERRSGIWIGGINLASWCGKWQRWKNVQIPQIYLCYFFVGCANFLVCVRAN